MIAIKNAKPIESGTKMKWNKVVEANCNLANSTSSILKSTPFVYPIPTLIYIVEQFTKQMVNVLSTLFDKMANYKHLTCSGC